MSNATGKPPHPIPSGFIWKRAAAWLVGLPLLVAFACVVTAWEKKSTWSEDSTLYIVLFSVGVMISIIGCCWDIRKCLLLFRRGVPFTAYVIRHGMVSHAGAVSITIRYDYRANRYEPSFSGMPKSYPIDGDVEIIIDPQNPKRYVLRSSLYPKNVSDKNLA